MSDEALLTYDSGWRTPSKEDEKAFVGAEQNLTNNGDYVVFSGGSVPGSYSGDGVGVVKLVHANANPHINKGGVQLPLCGYIGGNFAVNLVGAAGETILRSVYRVDPVHRMYSSWYVKNNVFVNGSNEFSRATSVRCVPKNL